MTKIKFRIFDKTNKKYIYSDEFYYDNQILLLKAFFKFLSDNINLDHEFGELEQFIELKDKNGKDIYEGDIVKTGYRKFIVNYNLDRAGYIPFANNDGCGCCADETIDCDNETEIIGNIYENQELLKS